MEYRYTEAYRVRGLVGPHEPVQIFYDSNVNAVLTANTEPFLDEVDRRTAIANSLLDKVFGNAKFEGELVKVIDLQTTEIKSERKKHGTDAFLIITVSGKLSSYKPSVEKEADNLHIAFDAISTEELQSQHKKAIDNIMSSLALTLSRISGYQKIASGVLLYKPDGSVIFPFNPQGSITSVHISTPLSVHDTKNVQEVVDKLKNSNGAHGLTRAITLYLSALSSRKDIFRSFLTAWTALEVFINKKFPDHEREFYSELEAGEYPEARKKYFGRIREVMHDKYTLMDRFSIVAIRLNEKHADADIEVVKRFKKVRDRFTHGETVSDGELDVENLLAFTKKYLVLQLNKL